MVQAIYPSEKCTCGRDLLWVPSNRSTSEHAGRLYCPWCHSSTEECYDLQVAIITFRKRVARTITDSTTQSRW